MVEGLTSIPAPDQGSACREDWVSINPATLRSIRSMAPASGTTRVACRHLPDADNPGDSGGEATPVPIPNTEVKLSSAEDTERAAFRENRSSPGLVLFNPVGASPGRGRATRGGILRTMTATAEEPKRRRAGSRTR